MLLTITGVLLVIFMFSIGGFIAHMESISYFDAYYACFITYSTIGFGDIDIYVSALLMIIITELSIL